MCCNLSKTVKTVNPDRRKSNHEYLEFMEGETDIGIHARKVGEGTFLNKALGPRSVMTKMESSPFMDRSYHVLEDEYNACEGNNFRAGTWKHYEASAFQTIKINVARATNSKVHLMLHRKSGYLGIMKVVPSQRVTDARAELNILASCKDCPFMIRLLDGFISSAGTSPDGVESCNYYLFLEYAPFRTLDHLAQAVKGIGSTNAKLYAMEIACALDFLHQKKIMHRDVTPANILVLISGHVALGDLGSAIQMNGTTLANRICGTYVTRPPEVWNGENYNLLVDIWQFGITLYNIISNTWPFLHPNKDKHIMQINAGKLIFNTSFSETAADLISKTIQVQPNLRPTAHAILKHKFFEELKYPYTPPFTPHELQEMYHFGDEEALIRELVSQLR